MKAPFPPHAKPREVFAACRSAVLVQPPRLRLICPTVSLARTLFTRKLCRSRHVTPGNLHLRETPPPQTNTRELFCRCVFVSRAHAHVDVNVMTVCSVNRGQMRQVLLSWSSRGETQTFVLLHPFRPPPPPVPFLSRAGPQTACGSLCCGFKTNNLSGRGKVPKPIC